MNSPEVSPMESGQVVQEVILIGLRRSGNHAVANWLVSLFKDAVFFNDVDVEKPFLKPPALKKGDFPDKQGLRLISFEDHALKVLKSKRSWLRKGASEGERNRTYILLLRDPLNLFASQLQAGMHRPINNHGLNYRQIYLSYVKESEANRKFLGEKILTVWYNDWKNSREYRESVARELGVSIESEELSGVLSFGGGSSFDGTNYDGNADRMQTEARYTRFIGNKDYELLLKNRLVLDKAGDYIKEVRAREYISSLYQNLSLWTSVADFLSLKILEPLVAHVRGYEFAKTMRRIYLKRTLS